MEIINFMAKLFPN